ncbi:DUF2293 domain-containing protein, partial [Streptomyces sp. NPDC003090]|uniref:DUF2293 domain-containing protein n=1 Tax=Streptomyces sp. NPDC003090 TaxID=3154274 RepID=UPI00381A6A97
VGGGLGHDHRDQVESVTGGAGGASAGHAVRASVRHRDTPYDALLLSGVPRHQARLRVGPAVEAVLASWRPGGEAGHPAEEGQARAADSRERR